MTRDELDAIRARVGAGTARGLSTQIEIDRDGTTRWVNLGPYLCATHEDAAQVRDLVTFIHAAPTDLQALLTEVERLTAERDDVNRVAQDILRDEGHPNYLNHGAAYTMGLLETRLKDARAKHMFSNGGTDDSP